MGTTVGKIVEGFKNFFGTEPVAGATWNFVQLSDKGPLTEYKDALHNNCPVLLVLKNNQEKVLHALFNFGYAQGSDNQDYLFVMDGYNNYGRFVKYNFWDNQVGYKIWVK